MRMYNAVFWDVTPCRSCVNWCFGGTYHLHIQVRKIRERGTSVSRWLYDCMMWGSCLPIFINSLSLFVTKILGAASLRADFWKHPLPYQHCVCPEDEARRHGDWGSRRPSGVLIPETKGMLSIYGSTAPFVGPWSLFHFLNPIHIG
jgi:hypothetical protein